ncbi:MAG TPA: tetratricopeptide repeat protein [Thermoanaerobaculia bacterium]|jgi:tetratricopeptide (TPR) repeat protein
MSQKITRRDMKRNELAETVNRTVGYVSEHRRGATEAVAIAVGAALLVGGFFLYRAWQERSAGTALSEGLAVLDAPLTGEPGATPGVKTYATAAERRTEAEKFLKKAAAHGSTSSGRAASVVLAAGGADKPEQSLDAFEKAARQGRSETAAAAEIDAAKLLVAQGKSSEAIERLKRAIDSPKSVAPKDALLFALGEIYEQAGNQADARATYQRLITDYPNSAYRSEARQRVPLS